MLFVALLIQATPPDIELRIDAEIQRVRIQPGAVARLDVNANPDSGSRVSTDVSPRAEGARDLRNVRVRVRGEARIADPKRGHQPNRRTE